MARNERLVRIGEFREGTGRNLLEIENFLERRRKGDGSKSFYSVRDEFGRGQIGRTRTQTVRAGVLLYRDTRHTVHDFY